MSCKHGAIDYMIRLLILFILVTILSYQVQAQTSQAVNQRQRKFSTQREQEDYWASQLFQNEYSKQRFNKFKETIKVIGDSLIYPDETIMVTNTNKRWTDIFASGLFYPAVITTQIKAMETDGEALNTAGSFTITNFEELPFLSKNEKQKRFRFWLFIKGFCNPVVCFIELTNDKANNKTDITTFIKGATLTFFKNAWPVI